MDDIILIIFASFILLLLGIGFFRKQNLLIIFSGIGFILLGTFLLQGFTYISGSNITTINNTFKTMTDTYSIWNSNFKNYIFVFLALFGITIIIIGALDFIRTGRINLNQEEQETEEDEE